MAAVAKFSIVIVAPLLTALLPCHNKRLAANKHSSTDPEVTAVTVMLTKLPRAVEIIGIERPAAGNDLGLRARILFFAAMLILGGQAALQPDPNASLSGDPDHVETIASAPR